MEETALRETFEETGIRAEIIDHTPFTVPSARPGDQRNVYFYKAKYVSGDAVGDKGEVDKAFWVEKERVLELLSFDRDKEMFLSLTKC